MIKILIIKIKISSVVIGLKETPNFYLFTCKLKLLSESLLLYSLLSESLLLYSLLSDSSISQSHSKLQFKSTNHIQS